MKKQAWYVTFSCKTAGAKIYYQPQYKKTYKQYKNKPLKVGSTKGVDWIAKAYVKVKSKKYPVKKFNLNTLAEKKRAQDIHATCDKYVPVDGDDFSKLCGIIDYFTRTYGQGIGYCGDKEPWYNDSLVDKRGTCGVLARDFKLLCDTYGVKCDYIDTWNRKGYTYEYRDCHAWNHVWIDNQLIIIDPMSLTVGALYNSIYRDEINNIQSKRATAVDYNGDETKMLLLFVNDPSAQTNEDIIYEYEKDKITVTDVTDGSYFIYTYSAKDGYWTEYEYDSDGVLITEDYWEE